MFTFDEPVNVLTEGKQTMGLEEFLLDRAMKQAMKRGMEQAQKKFIENAFKKTSFSDEQIAEVDITLVKKNT